jgi:hypothetical protein
LIFYRTRDLLSSLDKNRRDGVIIAFLTVIIIIARIIETAIITSSEATTFAFVLIGAGHR